MNYLYSPGISRGGNYLLASKFSHWRRGNVNVAKLKQPFPFPILRALAIAKVFASQV